METDEHLAKELDRLLRLFAESEHCMAEYQRKLDEERDELLAVARELYKLLQEISYRKIGARELEN